MVKDNTGTLLVSIILPVSNGEKYLKECLESMLKQSYEHIEIIAIDDFSRDGSFGILKKFARKDHRLRIWKNVKRYGTVVSLNRALKRARGKFIAFAKQEDRLHPERIEKQLRFLLSRDKLVAVGSQCVFLDERNKKIGQSEFPQDSFDIYKRPLDQVSLQLETMMINKYRIPKDLLYFHSTKQPYVYSDLYIKLFQYGQLMNLPDVLYYHRKLQDAPLAEKHFSSILRLWLRAQALFDYRPPLRFFLFSFLLSVPTKQLHIL